MVAALKERTRQRGVVSLTLVAAAVAMLAVVFGTVGRQAGSTLAAGDAVPGQYIVVLVPGADPAATANEMAREHGLGLSFVYSHALNGFAARIPDARLARIQADPRVLYVEQDQVVTIDVQETPTGLDRIFAPGNGNLDLDGVDDYRVDVDVAVIDTGIDLDHPDLNVYRSTNCSGGGPFKQSCGNGGDDDNSHGTHVAGTIGALDNGIGVAGVAPGARLWAVKVLNSQGSGYMSWIVAGIDYVTANAGAIEVANMSLGCECSSNAMNTAISNSVAAGIVYAVAAGNSDKNADTFSPANHPDVITVSALADFDGEPGGLGSPTCRSDQDDTLADFSNWGPKVELAAPGVCILSTVPGGYATYSGTSMASPHAAGAAALLASMSKPTNKTQALAIRQTLIDNGNFNWTDDSGDGVKEPLLDVSNTTVFAPATVDGSGGGAGEPTPTPEATATPTPAPEPTATPTPTPAPNGIALDATGYKVKGVQKADLTWSGATGDNVEVYRDGAVLATTANNGAYTDNIDNRGGGSYTYKICEAGTATCSNEVTIVF